MFSPIPTYTLTTAVNGNGTVTKAPDQPNYYSGTPVNLTATADPGWKFTGWSGDASGGANPLQVIMDADKNITATFSPIPTYILTASANGNGTVSKSPDQVNYLSGTVVSLFATPDIGTNFTGWSGDASGSTNPLLVTMNANKTITASFETFNFGGILIFPADNSTDVSQSPTFLWNTYLGATSYQLLVSLQPDFSTTVIDVTDPTDTTYSASGLLAQQLYYWKVVITTGSGTVESSVWRFTTGGLLKPVITVPVDGATNVAINPTPFNWNAVSGATAYNLEVSTSTNFNSPVLQQTDIAALFFNATTLSDGTAYFARVQAKNGIDPNSEWSDTVSFTTAFLPGSFSLISPNVLPLQPAGMVKFLWHSSQYAESYNLVVTNTSSNSVELDTTVTDTSFTGELISAGTIFSWDLTALNGAGTTNSNNGPLTFTTADTFYVAPTGTDNVSNTGAELDPFLTIDFALLNTLPGSIIKVYTGSYPEAISLFFERTLIGYGPSAPRVSNFVISSSNVHIENFDLNNTSIGANDIGIVVVDPSGGTGAPLECITINNVNLIPSSGFETGFLGDYATGVELTNCDFSGIDLSGGPTAGIYLIFSSDLIIKNVVINESVNYGMYLISSSNLTFQDIIITDSFFGSSGPGILLSDVTNSTFTRLSSSNSLLGLSPQTMGMVLNSGDDITFADCSFENNSDSGVLLERIIGSSTLSTITNINFTGSCEFSSNGAFGIEAEGISSTEFISGVSLTGTPVFSDNTNAGIYLMNDVTAFSVDGGQFVNSTPGPDGLAVATGSSIPSDIAVNNSLFSNFDNSNPAFLLFGGMTNDVDARNNTFLDVTDVFALEDLIVDVLDNPLLGDVITDGASFGPNPEYVVESLNPTYVSATYLVDIDFYPKSDGYISLSGTFSYDTTKLQYQGFLNDGTINDNAWSFFSITESVSGSTASLDFTAWGINPIYTPGKLFTLNMTVKSTADTSLSPAIISGDSTTFTGLTTSGPPAFPFIVTNGVIDYFDTNSPVQTKGDVNLDGIVGNDDFTLLLLYVAGNTSLITDPQALDNADFDSDTDIDNDDLTALYNFINGIVPPAAPIIAGGGMSFDNLQFIQDNKSLSLPILLKNVEQLNSFEIELLYDPTLISYQAFTTELATDDYNALGHELAPGIARYVVYSKETLTGNLNPGELILRVIESSLADETEIKTRYKFNGRDFIDGPVISVSDGVITDLEEELIPDQFEVSQNYPNPFNPTTTIRFGLVDPGLVSIRVYNMLGEEVRTLVNNEFNTGYHEVTWNGNDNFGTKVSSGTYIYRVIAGSKVMTKKMLLLK